MARIVWDARTPCGNVRPGAGPLPMRFANAGLPDRSTGTAGAMPAMSCRSPPGGGWFVSAATRVRGERRAPRVVHAVAAPAGQSGRNETRLIITASTLCARRRAHALQFLRFSGIFALGAFHARSVAPAWRHSCGYRTEDDLKGLSRYRVASTAIAKRQLKQCNRFCVGCCPPGTRPSHLGAGPP